MKTEIILIGTSSVNREKIKEEFKKIQELIGESNSYFNIQIKEKKLRKDLPSLIQNAKSEIIHISAEGKNDGTILFHDENGEEELEPEDLAEFFKHNNVNYVVLNFCYSKKAAELIANHVQCAIGINGDIGGESAINFSENFYLSLKDNNQPLNQKSIDEAFSKGQAAANPSERTEKNTEKYIKIFGGRKPQPEMQIIEPSDGSKVPYPCKCKGIFKNLPQGATMWAYVNATIQGKFYLVEIRDYPNGSTDGKWEADLKIGPPKDNHNYRIGVLIVDPETTQELKLQSEKALEQFGYFALDSLPNHGTKVFSDRAVTRQ